VLDFLVFVAFVGLAVLEAVRIGLAWVDAGEQGRQRTEKFSERGKGEWVD